jgi:peptidoglycan DL-endopeptidase CwlO
VTRASLVGRPSIVLLLVASLLAVMVTTAEAEPTSDEARSQLQQARERLEQLEGEFNAVVDDYNDAQERLDHAEARVEEAQAELERLREENDQLTATTANHARQIHKFGPTVEVATLLSADDPSAASEKAAVLRRALTGRQNDLETLAATRASMQAAEERLQEEQDEAEALAAEVEERRDEIEATMEAQEEEVARNERVLAAAIEREEAERRAREAEQRRREAEQRRQERQRQQQRQQQQAQETSEEASEPEEAPSAPAPRANAQVAVDAALSKLGKPYRWGATGPNAFDCSGLMVWAWAQAGVSLPRTSASQFANLRRISRSELQPGDLVFAGSPRVHHVGMYIGNGQIVHAPRSGVPVEIRSMERSDLRGFGRPG